MIKLFRNFLTEQEIKSKSAKHITHLAGEEHFNGRQETQADLARLEHLHKWMSGEKTNTKSVEIKADGSPSFEMGYVTNPQSGQKEFGVAYKGASKGFAFTPEDVQEKFGHSPGLASKMGQILEHGSKVVSKIHGVYQGDFMGSKKDGTLKKEGNEITHKENLIKYHYPTDSEEGRKLAKAKVSLHLHTRIDKEEPEYDIDKSKFYSSSDVHIFNNTLNRKNLNYNLDDRKDFEKHFNAAHKSLAAIENHDELVGGHSEHLHTYINKTVREGTSPNVQGYTSHLKTRLQKEVDKVKKPETKLKKATDMQNMVNHISRNKDGFKNLFDAHKSLDSAKGVLLKTLQSSGYNQKHTIDGKETHAEGFVVANGDGTLSKVVDRSKEGFAGKNLNK